MAIWFGKIFGQDAPPTYAELRRDAEVQAKIEAQKLLIAQQEYEHEKAKHAALMAHAIAQYQQAVLAQQHPLGCIQGGYQPSTGIAPLLPTTGTGVWISDSNHTHPNTGGYVSGLTGQWIAPVTYQPIGMAELRMPPAPPPMVMDPPFSLDELEAASDFIAEMK